MDSTESSPDTRRTVSRECDSGEDSLDLTDPNPEHATICTKMKRAMIHQAALPGHLLVPIPTRMATTSYKGGISACYITKTCHFRTERPAKDRTLFQGPGKGVP